MKKQYFMPQPQGAYLKWHDNVKAGVTATTPGATAADVTMLAADNAALHLKTAAVTNAAAASLAAHKDLNLTMANSKANARKLAKRIKDSPAYTEVIGTQLQIIGSEDTTDMAVAQPTLDIVTKAAGVVEVGFYKLLAEGVHVYSQRDGEAGFSLLASETHSPYVDNRALLVPGKPENRHYKAVFFQGKTEVGKESDVAQTVARP